MYHSERAPSQRCAQARYHNLQRCLTSAHRRRVSPLALFHQRPCSSSRNAAAQCFRPRPCSGLPHRHHALRPALSQIARRGAADRSLKSYFLADNTIPWWAIALSIVSAETITLTIISIPGVAFAGDFGFLQVVIGYMLGRVVVAALFLPRYFAGEMLTAYQLIDRRFGGDAAQGHRRHSSSSRAPPQKACASSPSPSSSASPSARATCSPSPSSPRSHCSTPSKAAWPPSSGPTSCRWPSTSAAPSSRSSRSARTSRADGRVIHSVAAAAGKFHIFNFALNLTDDLHLLGRRPRRHLPHHGLARHRPAHGAAPARRAQPA